MLRACGGSTPAGAIGTAVLRERFEQTIVGFMDLVEAAKHYRCAKRAWVELLGEHPRPECERPGGRASAGAGPSGGRA